MTMHRACLVLIAAGLFLAAADKEDPIKAEREKLQGTWTITELTDAGKKAPDKERDSIVIEFKGDKLTFSVKGPGTENHSAEGSYTVDPSKSPAEMDLTIEANGKQMTIQALYELKDDQLKLCHANDKSGPRPKALEATEKTVVAVLKKKTP